MGIRVMYRAKATILCIDDHRNGLIGRKMLLEQSGYQVLEATSGEEGMQLFLSRAVDAVILDQQMPGMNGDVVAARMKFINSQTPIMLLSGYTTPPQRKLQSVDKFLSKSESPTALLSAVHELLNLRPNSFFHRWLDRWRVQNQTVTK